jgi:hypothetical protein
MARETTGPNHGCHGSHARRASLSDTARAASIRMTGIHRARRQRMSGPSRSVRFWRIPPETRLVDRRCQPVGAARRRPWLDQPSPPSVTIQARAAPCLWGWLLLQATAIGPSPGSSTGGETHQIEPSPTAWRASGLPHHAGGSQSMGRAHARIGQSGPTATPSWSWLSAPPAVPTRRLSADHGRRPPGRRERRRRHPARCPRTRPHQHSRASLHTAPARPRLVRRWNIGAPHHLSAPALHGQRRQRRGSDRPTSPKRCHRLAGLPGGQCQAVDPQHTNGDV